MKIQIIRSLLFVFAISFFSCAPVKTEDDAITINKAGVEFMDQGNYEKALKSFMEAIKNTTLSFSTKGSIYRNIAITFSGLENFDSSLHYSTLAAKCYTKNSYDYLVNMADVELISGRIEKALSHLLKAAAIDSDDMAVNNSLGLVYLGEYDETFTDYDKALIYNKKAFAYAGDRVTEEVLGRNYYRLGDYKNAELHYKSLLNKNPDAATYLLYGGMIKYRLDKKSEADLLFNKLLIVDSTYKETVDDFKDYN